MTPRLAWLAGLQFLALAAGVAWFLWQADPLPAPALAPQWLAALLVGIVAVAAVLQGRLTLLEALAIELAALATVSAETGQQALHFVAKPAALVAVLALAWHRWGWRPLLLAALAFSLAGDVFMMLPDRFLPGLVAFLLAHACFVALFRQGVPWFPSRLALAACLGASGAMVAFLLVFGSLPAGLRLPVAAYSVAIALMAAQAFGRALLLRDRPALAVAAGAMLFMVSDSLLAVDRFAFALPMAQFWMLATYYAAQLLIVRHALPPAPARDDQDANRSSPPRAAGAATPR